MKLYVLYISALSVLINFIKLLVSELIISYLGFIIILLYLREIYRMCKGKSTSATKIQNAAESLFSKKLNIIKLVLHFSVEIE